MASYIGQLYREITDQGDVFIEMKVFDFDKGQYLWAGHDTFQEFRPPIDIIPAEYTGSSERLIEDMLDVATVLTRQIL